MVVLCSTQVGNQRDTNKETLSRITCALCPLKTNPPSFIVMDLRQILGLSSSLALISIKGLELAFVAMILKRAPCNPPVLPHRHTAEINSIGLRLVQEFILLGGHDLR